MLSYCFIISWNFLEILGFPSRSLVSISCCLVFKSFSNLLNISYLLNNTQYTNELLWIVIAPYPLFRSLCTQIRYFCLIVSAPLLLYYQTNMLEIDHLEAKDENVERSVISIRESGMFHPLTSLRSLDFKLLGVVSSKPNHVASNIFRTCRVVFYRILCSQLP